MCRVVSAPLERMTCRTVVVARKLLLSIRSKDINCCLPRKGCVVGCLVVVGRWRGYFTRCVASPGWTVVCQFELGHVTTMFFMRGACSSVRHVVLQTSTFKVAPHLWSAHRSVP